ncbi:RND family transporter [Mycobacterium sp.]|uniref:MMPL/RND family transporter n=1 Tax=Mycobacterium sp. TaxID=1785 RepID=UPI0025DC0FD9|nr:RND family transporter [Mycobacterium sp.]
MSSRTGAGEVAKPGGVFDRIGDVVVRWPFLVIACWIALAAALALTLPPLPAQAAKRDQKPLPDDAPTSVLAKQMTEAWLQPPAPSNAPADESAPPAPSAPAGESAPAPPSAPAGESAPAAPSSAPAGESAPATANAPKGGADAKTAIAKLGGGSQGFIILTDENGLTPADEDVYRKVVQNLQQVMQGKVGVQDILSNPQMRDLLTSKDGKAITLPIAFPDAAVSPTTVSSFRQIKDIIKHTTEGTTLTAYVSGPAATVVDATAMAQEDAHFIEIATVISVLIILIVIYRNIVTMFVPLLNIGASLATSQGVLSGLSELGLPVNMQTLVLMSAVMIGAGTDYAVFLISRYHDYVRHGQDSDQAVKNALMSIGKVIAASAATVSVTFLAMVFTKLEVFSAVGPAISIAVIVALLSAITLLPALLVITGRRGWIKPRRDLTTRMWRRTGTRVVRRPRIHLIGSLILLATLAACTSVMRFNYDDLKTMPDNVESSKGYDAMNRHFPMNALTPMILFVKSSHDLRTPHALADLEQMASRVSQVPGITMVRGLTRPNGEPLEQMKLSWQAGQVGDKLDEASNQITNHGDDLDHLVNGSNQLADALAQLRDQVATAVSSLSGVVGPLTTMEQAAGGDQTIAALNSGAAITGQIKSLSENLHTSTDSAENVALWAAPMVSALNASPECNADPACVKSRAGLAAMVDANNNGTLNVVKRFAKNLDAAAQAQTVGQTLDKIQQTLTEAATAMTVIKNLQSTMDTAKQGTQALADGSRAIAGGVKQLVDSTRLLGGGLNEASSFLLGMKRDAEKPSMSGFNLPPEITTRDEYKQGAKIFLSPDGHAAQYFVQSAVNPFTTDAMDQIDKIIKAAYSAEPNTELADASLAVAGIPSALKDTRDFYNNDINFIVVATILIVFLILVALLRAVVAPLYLIGSVLLSYLSAMGLGVLVFQLILGQNLHWSLPGLSFILLVAVGADYNMLLISRIRDESPHGVRVGVIRTVGTTGGVITSAGLIFAASMFGLMTASIYTMAEAGFILGMGILIDTFVVRTITVPALAAMIGQRNWWPSNLGKSPAQVYRAQQLKQSQRNHLTGRLVRMKVIPDARNEPVPVVAPSPEPPVEPRPPKDDILVRLKLVPSRKKPLPSSVAGSAPVADGKPKSQRLPKHSLPLFDLSGVAHRLTEDVSELVMGSSKSTNGKSTNGKSANGKSANGKGKSDRYVGHSLPLFGHDVLATRPILVGANGNGQTNGNGHGKQSHEDDVSGPLPLFGTDVPARGDGDS